MNINKKMLVGQIVGLFVLFALLLFLPAGTIAWPAGWLFLMLFFSFVTATVVWLFRHNPGLLQERMRMSTPDQQGWDKLLFPVINISFLVWLILMALDAVRLHWSHVPVWVQIVGALILVCSFYTCFTAFRENAYLSPVVRFQEERDHKVVSTGPYHYVRHPMYAAILAFVLGTPLLLGSWYGVPFGVLLLSMLARRAVLEEHMLQKELDGYTAYMAHVKYRLIPYIW